MRSAAQLLGCRSALPEQYFAFRWPSKTVPLAEVLSACPIRPETSLRAACTPRAEPCGSSIVAPATSIMLACVPDGPALSLVACNYCHCLSTENHSVHSSPSSNQLVQQRVAADRLKFGDVPVYYCFLGRDGPFALARRLKRLNGPWSQAPTANLQ